MMTWNLTHKVCFLPHRIRFDSSLEIDASSLQDVGSAAESWCQTVEIDDVLRSTAQIPNFPEIMNRVIKTTPMWRDPQSPWSSPEGRVIQSSSLETALIHFYLVQELEAPRLLKTHSLWILAYRSAEKTTFHGP